MLDGNKLLVLVLAMLLLLPSVVHAQDRVDICLFYGEGCPHCARMRIFLGEMQDKYPSLNVIEKEVYFNQDNNRLFQEMASAFGVQVSGVPTAFIDDRVIVGFSDSIGESVESEIKRCVEYGCESPLVKLGIEDSKEDVLQISGDKSPLEDPGKTKLKQQITIPAVISAAAVDAINPCAFAVLIILLTTILASSNKKRALLAGMAFTLSIYISYFLMGIGLYSAVKASGLSHSFYAVVAVLAMIIGLFNLKDYLWYGKWFVMEVPMSWRPKLKAVLRGVTSVPGAFLIGFVVSLFLLPCTSGPYIVILGLLAEATTRTTALLLLLLYNLIFVLPMLAITLAIYSGLTTTEKAEEWRQKKLKVLHLIAGLIILLLGVGMMMALYLGLV